MATKMEEGSYGSKDWQALESAIEAEYEAIRCRDVNVHVVPTHCSWFSWTNVHPLEERALTSFFTGKSENRTPAVYLEIRNWIMKKYHANPNVHVELKDSSELTFGDLDARQEVMEFLDYWGLINFHPFPPTESATTNSDGDEAVKTHSLVENLYHFETVQSGPPVVQRTNIAMSAVPSRLFPEPAIAEELKPEKPAVEYHCNSCSADCSRKRYHCQTQADYDLCSECFTNRKFGSAMSLSDFILMEPAEVPGVTGGNWTDQETLLLLEALELYKENWNEIAEHVATKTKAQCILHFVQMPIEDTFLDCNDEIDVDPQQNADPTSTNCNSSVPIDASKIIEGKHGANEDQPSSLSMETLKPEDADGIKLCQEMGENCAVKALGEAFEAVGSLLTSGVPFTFVEAGNPVMALAAFLARLVGPDVIAASSRCSIKSISCSSPSMQIAARHCFVLEDPPDDRKEPVGSESSVADMDDQDAQNEENQKDEKSIAVLDGGDPSHEQSIENSAQDGKIPLVSDDNCTDKSDGTKESDGMVTEGEVAHSNLIDSSNSELLKDHPPGTELPKGNLRSTESQKDCTPTTELPKYRPPATELLKGQPPYNDLPKDQQPSTELLKASPQCNELPKNHSPATELPKDHQPSVVKKSDDIASKEELVTSSAKEAKHVRKSNDQAKECSKTGNQDSTETKDDHNIDNFKRSAITALSAAAVKAKLLANQEEDQIRQLGTLLIDKQLHKLETKLACFNEVDSVVMRVREQLERSRQKLYHERAQIISARLGLPASSSRTMPPSLPTNRVAMNFANLVPRPSVNMISQTPLISRPVMPLAPPSSNLFASSTAAGDSIRPSSQDKLSTVGMK